MKRTIWLMICLLMSIVAVSQTQQGYVKTKGRLSSNGTVIAGTSLSSATVTVKGGNPVMSGNNGKFSLSISANKYYLQNVQKQGYVLIDPDVLAKQYEYSKNPLVLVLEDIEQKKTDQRAIERKISRNLYDQLQKRSDELDALKERHQITEEKYRELLQKLNKDQDDNEKLISEMVERYSKTDFDEIDGFNLRISQFILDGKLTEADSLLNKKGNINSRIVSLRQHQVANAQEEQEIGKRLKKLEKRKEKTKKELDDLAQDCFSKYQIFKLQHQNDSAIYYMRIRAGLDSTNMEWQYEVATLISDYQADYKGAIKIYKNILHYYDEPQHIKDDFCIARCYNALGNLYLGTECDSLALPYLEKALNIYQDLFNDSAQYVAACFNDIGVLYHKHHKLKNNDLAMTYYKQAMCLYKKSENSDSTTHALATLYNNIANLYSEKKQYQNALDYYNKVLFIKDVLHHHTENHRATAKCYRNMGITFMKWGKEDKALQCFQKAIGIFSEVYGKGHPEIAMTYYEIGHLYERNHQTALSIEHYKSALSVFEQVYSEPYDNHEVAQYIADCYIGIGRGYFETGKQNLAINMIDKAIKIYTLLYGNSQETMKVKKLKSKMQGNAH